MRSAYKLADRTDNMWGVTRRECVALQAEDNESELLERVYTANEAYQAGKSLVLIEGTHEGRAGLQVSLK